jgi:hypothetical protein
VIWDREELRRRDELACEVAARVGCNLEIARRLLFLKWVLHYWPEKIRG